MSDNESALGGEFEGASDAGVDSDEVADAGCDSEEAAESKCIGGRGKSAKDRGRGAAAKSAGVNKTIAKGKAKGKAKVKNGLKLCSGCNKWLEPSAFPPGKAMCSDDNNAMRNLRASARAQNEMEWWNEVCADAVKLRETLKAYKVRCALTGKRNKRAAFSICQYREEVTQSQSVMFDGVYEMFHLKAYIHFSRGKTFVSTRILNIHRSPSSLYGLTSPGSIMLKLLFAETDFKTTGKRFDVF
jgi:hypothetical protein